MSKRLGTNESGELSPAGAVSEVPSLPVSVSGESEARQTYLLSEDEFRSFLKHLSDKGGGFAEFAPKLGVSAQFLSAVCRGKEKPGKTILERLGVKAKRFYQMEVEAGE